MTAIAQLLLENTSVNTTEDDNGNKQRPFCVIKSGQGFLYAKLLLSPFISFL